MRYDDNKHIKKYKDSVIIKRLLKYARPYIWEFIFSIVLTLLVVAAQLMPAYLEGEVIGALASVELTNQEKLSKAFLLFMFFLGFLLVASVINYFSSMILQKAGQKVVLNIREDVFTHIENLSIAQINKTPVGKLVTRVTSDINAINDLYTTVIVNLLRYIVTIIAVIVIMIILSPILFLYIMIATPVLVVSYVLFKIFARKQYRLVRGCVSNINTFLSENLSGMKITQIFNQEDKKLNEFKEKNDDYKKKSVKEVVIMGLFRPFIYCIYVLTQMLILYRGYLLIGAGRLTVTSYVKFYGYIDLYFNPIQQIADQFNILQSSFAASERIFEILDEKPSINYNDGIELDSIEGKIEFDHVWFRYNENEWILKDVSFTINPKETVAFVGATGAGKTTILSLIVRNYEIQKGEIRIDGIDVKKIKIASLRKKIGQMLQDVFLFSGDIRNNITLREESITDDEIYEAIKYVNADKLVDRLDGGLDYKVMERGANFSQGERQLLSFARTIVHKPNVMILDEATANIDTETEVLIQDSLNKMRNVGTMLIVAHRLSTIKNANKIIVLNKGMIVEMGTHNELLDKHGMYYDLYELQYKNS
ncbi:MAG: ABC transporter ATP-binding protein [Acholeplasmatales bacterium]|nr:ABC transporter ATP-binding protein [Acholeplasmatales bacterium]